MSDPMALLFGKQGPTPTQAVAPSTTSKPTNPPAKTPAFSMSTNVPFFIFTIERQALQRFRRHLRKMGRDDDAACLTMSDSPHLRVWSCDVDTLDGYCRIIAKNYQGPMFDNVATLYNAYNGTDSGRIDGAFLFKHANKEVDGLDVYKVLNCLSVPTHDDLPANFVAQMKKEVAKNPLVARKAAKSDKGKKVVATEPRTRRRRRPKRGRSESADAPTNWVPPTSMIKFQWGKTVEDTTATFLTPHSVRYGDLAKDDPYRLMLMAKMLEPIPNYLSGKIPEIKSLDDMIDIAFALNNKNDVEDSSKRAKIVDETPKDAIVEKGQLPRPVLNTAAPINST